LNFSRLYVHNFNGDFLKSTFCNLISLCTQRFNYTTCLGFDLGLFNFTVVMIALALYFTFISLYNISLLLVELAGEVWRFSREG